MNDKHRELIDKLTVDLAGILEQIYTVQELEHASLVSIENGLEASEAGVVIQKTIADLESAETNIQHAIDLLSSVCD